MEDSGSKEIKSRKLGGNRSFSEDFKANIMTVVKASYADFGPTFAAEKLLECQGLSVNRETLRIWMIETGLWKGRPRKSARIHQSRERTGLGLENSFRLMAHTMIGLKEELLSAAFWSLSYCDFSGIVHLFLKT